MLSLKIPVLCDCKLFKRITKLLLIVFTMEKMWFTFCIFTLMVKAVWAEECLDRRGLRPLPKNLNPLSDCLMDCSMRTYVKKQLLQHRPSIEFKDSTQGDHGEFCWSTYLKCIVGGEIFDRAFVILPWNITSAEQVEVITSPAATKLSVHPSLPLISDHCGLLYEVSQYFSTENTDSSFCIQLRTLQLESGEGALRCPPYLLILWKSNSSQAHQQSGG
ncbi:hypothetical protein NQD34_017352 [Periophthalmus magnuspinnatus]|uniref:uncharacterized protein LOC129457378 n=1 Tax=Periophthalmus magnuspinnatus TaxID=409849 RepID=UPI0022CA265D|nr:uncharacterized protein LOC129457378 [Periophthalmus magnuspinnatus]KAJ0013018.1 hypothetical protein NQD34_017352 [Periophthalmus magnuspinnatus]